MSATTRTDLALPGNYQYHYPTFVDSPQFITIHFLTPDQQRAFVSYPNHPNFKAPQIIPLEWFKSVILKSLDQTSTKKQPQKVTSLSALRLSN